MDTVALVLGAQRQRMIDAARAEQDVVSRARKRRDDAMLAERAPRDPQLAQEAAARRELDLRMAPVIAEGLATMDREHGRADMGRNVYRLREVPESPTPAPVTADVAGAWMFAGARRQSSGACNGAGAVTR